MFGLKVLKFILRTRWLCVDHSRKCDVNSNLKIHTHKHTPPPQWGSSFSLSPVFHENGYILWCSISTLSRTICYLSNIYLLQSSQVSNRRIGCFLLILCRHCGCSVAYWKAVANLPQFNGLLKSEPNINKAQFMHTVSSYKTSSTLNLLLQREGMNEMDETRRGRTWEKNDRFYLINWTIVLILFYFGALKLSPFWLEYQTNTHTHAYNHYSGVRSNHKSVVATVWPTFHYLIA